MRRFVGEAQTVGQLIELLSTLPPEKPVRTKTISHSWAPEVHEYDDVVTVDAG